MKILLPFLTVIVITIIAYICTGIAKLHFLFGIIIPYAAITIFVFGLIYRFVLWGRSPVPFRIPTTCGQQKSLGWIRHDKLENPSNSLQVIGRMLLEIFLFRSLFRNTKTNLANGNFTHSPDKWLWSGSLVFHWAFLIIILRHLRFFTDPVPFFVVKIEHLDGFLQIGLPVLFISGILLLINVTYLFLRRVVLPEIRYMSLPSDYFPLFIIMAIGITGYLMRYVTKVDVVTVKKLTAGLFMFRPEVPEGISPIFYIHLFLACVLAAYTPFSKLLHMGGVLLSPTRNMANNNRMKRHINPWSYPVKVHTYKDYEDEFRDKMIQVGIPVEKVKEKEKEKGKEKVKE